MSRTPSLCLAVRLDGWEGCKNIRKGIGLGPPALPVDHPGLQEAAADEPSRRKRQANVDSRAVPSELSVASRRAPGLAGGEESFICLPWIHEHPVTFIRMVLADV
ncbi:hypothetical protein scyTo_0022002 [Scyliorhinus torazame]|uniref:Uncharacterized protein n=1 Tax=Scyliorhinus torazame TaxID=75743 RepID=A0A401QAP6_SCYTO|nr:hypothetical protein [Scyliorhinus torazame]